MFIFWFKLKLCFWDLLTFNEDYSNTNEGYSNTQVKTITTLMKTIPTLMKTIPMWKVLDLKNQLIVTMKTIVFKYVVIDFPARDFVYYWPLHSRARGQNWFVVHTPWCTLNLYLQKTMLNIAKVWTFNEFLFDAFFIEVGNKLHPTEATRNQNLLFWAQDRPKTLILAGFPWYWAYIRP